MDEPKMLIDPDSICYGCKYYYEDTEKRCASEYPCFEGSMNGYRMDG